MKCETCQRPILINREDKQRIATLTAIVIAIMLLGAVAEWFATVDLLLLLKWTIGLSFAFIGIPVWVWVKSEQLRLEREQ